MEITKLSTLSEISAYCLANNTRLRIAIDQAGDFCVELVTRDNNEILQTSSNDDYYIYNDDDSTVHFSI